MSTSQFTLISFLSITELCTSIYHALRVALERARPETEWNISGLEFSSNPGGGFGTKTNAVLTVPRSQLEHEIDFEARDAPSDRDSVFGKENFLVEAEADSA